MDQSQLVFIPVSRPPELRRLRPSSGAIAPYMSSRLTPPGIAATAAWPGLQGDELLLPSHAPRNCGDCGLASMLPPTRLRAVSRPPELRRLRPSSKRCRNSVNSKPVSRPPELRRLRRNVLTVFWCNTTSVSRPPELRRLRQKLRDPKQDLSEPSHAPRNCGDCGAASG